MTANDQVEKKEEDVAEVLDSEEGRAGAGLGQGWGMDMGSSGDEALEDVPSHA